MVNIHSKLDEKSEKCIFIGYSHQSKAYRLYNPVSGNVIISRDVVFNEEASWEWSPNKEKPVVSVRSDNGEDDTAAPTDTGLSTPTNSSCSSTESSHCSSFGSSTETLPRKFRSLAEIYESCSLALLAADAICYEDAAEQTEWRNAMLEEIQAIEKNSTWELVDPPKGKNVVGLKWVFRTKYNADGSI